MYGPFANEEIVGEELASVRDQAAGGFHRTSRDGRVFVEPAGLRGQTLLEWEKAAAAFARTLPTKPVARERR